METVADVDIDILLSLSFKDLRLACQSNQYYYKLCQSPRILNKVNHVKTKVKNIIHSINATGFTLQLKKIPFKIFRQLTIESNIDDLNLDNDIDEEDMEEIISILDDDYPDFMTIKKKAEDYYCTFYFIRDDDDMNIDTFRATQNQLIEFLTHLIYNGHIVSIPHILNKVNYVKI